MLAIWWEDPNLVYWIVGGIVFYFVGIPLVVLFRQKFAATPDCVELELHTLNPQLAQFLMETTNQLYTLGFDEPTLVHMPSAAPDIKVYLILLVNRPQGDKAMVTAIVGEGVNAIQTWYIEFSTRYANDQCVDTFNTSELSAFDKGPETIRSQVPSVTDVGELYRLHQYRMKTGGIAEKKVLFEPGKAVQYLVTNAMKKAYDKQVVKGWLWFDAPGDCYRPTFKGAYLMTWGILFPMKQFRTMAMRRKEQAILAEFRKQGSART